MPINRNLTMLNSFVPISVREGYISDDRNISVIGAGKRVSNSHALCMHTEGSQCLATEIPSAHAWR